MNDVKQRPIIFSALMVQAILAGRKTQTRRALKIQPSWVESNNPIVSSGWQYKGKKGLPKLSSWPTKEDFATALLECEKCPYGQVGDQLWVRETFTQGYDMTLLADEGDGMNAVSIIYKADGKELYRECPKEVAENWGDWSCDGEGDPVFKPSIHMPRWASRILLEITDIRIERLQDISRADAMEEGIISDHVIVGAHCAGGMHTEMTATRYFYDGGDEEGYESAVDAYAALWESIYGAGSWADNPWVWRISFRVVEPQGAQQGTKYDWTHVPDCVQWIATDCNGYRTLWTKEPKSVNGYWRGEKGTCKGEIWPKNASRIETPNWRDSLEQRPVQGGDL